LKKGKQWQAGYAFGYTGKGDTPTAAVRALRKRLEEEKLLNE